MSLRCYAGFSLVGVTRATLCGGLWASRGGRRAAGCSGFSRCSRKAQYLQLPRSRAQAQELGLTGLVAPQHLGPSWIREETAWAGGFFTTEPPEKPEFH